MWQSRPLRFSAEGKFALSRRRHTGRQATDSLRRKDMIARRGGWTSAGISHSSRVLIVSQMVDDLAVVYVHCEFLHGLDCGSWDHRPIFCRANERFARSLLQVATLQAQPQGGD